MAIYRNGEEIVVGTSIRLDVFPSLVQEHSRRYRRTAEIEHIGAAFLMAGLPAREVRSFVHAVCAWGGYAGIAGRILQNNRPEAIEQALRDAVQLLGTEPHQHSTALARINLLHSLGSPSFASKHLRFLRPDICPVYDAVLRDALPFSFDPDGYQDFAIDCLAISNHLQNAGVVNPVGRPGSRWYAADVEAALFVSANGWVA